MEGKLVQQGGAVTFWSCADRTNREHLVRGFTDLGLAKLAPDARHAPSALRAALSESISGPTRLIRPLRDKHGFLVLDEARGTDSNDYSQVGVARVVGEEGAETLDFSPLFPYDLRSAVRGEYAVQIGLLPGATVGTVLVAAMDKLGGTRLRPNGGIYWLSRRRLAEWRAIAEVVEGAASDRSNRLYIIEHDLDADSVRAVHDGVIEAVTSELDSINRELLSGELGVKAVGTRSARVRELLSRTRDYEAVLGIGLEGLRAAVENAQEAAGRAAILAANAPDDSAAAASGAAA
jgi:hypothetical protein